MLLFRWRFSVVALYAGPVSTGMSNGVGVQLPMMVIYLGMANHLDQLSLAILPWVGAMSIGHRAVGEFGWCLVAVETA